MKVFNYTYSDLSVNQKEYVFLVSALVPNPTFFLVVGLLINLDLDLDQGSTRSKKLQVSATRVRMEKAKYWDRSRWWFSI